ncbi:MAG: methyl-accepting chemotaxis protein [Clostridiales bacterium]|nr:methyl-accepting chemotaxis protein [Clostridiales bacterium]
MDLKKKFLVFFTVFALLPLVLSGGIIYYVVYNSNMKDAYSNVQNMETFAAQSMQNVLSIIEQIGFEAAEDPSVLGYLKSVKSGENNLNYAQDVKHKLNSMVSKYELQENIFILDTNGKCIVDAEDKLTGQDLSKMDYFVEPKKTGTQFIGRVKKSIATGNPIFVIAKPVMGPGNELLGVFGQAIDLQKLSEKYISKLVIGKTGFVYIMQEDGTTIVHPNKEEILTTKIAETEGGKQILQKKAGTIRYTYGVDKLAAFETEPKYGWIYVATLPVDEFTGTLNTVIELLMIIGAVVLVIVPLLAFIIAKKFSKPIVDIKNLMEKVAEGDFTANIEVKGKDEIAFMANSINNTIESIKGAVATVKENSEQTMEYADTLNVTSREIASSMGEVSNAILEVSSGVQNQADELADVVNLILDFSNELDNIYDKLNNVKNNTSEAEIKANGGKEKIDGLMNVIEEVKLAFNTVLEKINRLNASVERIGNITEVINGIARQTNLLALNAAIEAARAGEVGRGFAVVADEVRKLAEESERSAGEIKSLVDVVAIETGDVINTTKSLEILMENEVDVANETIQSFNDVLSSVNNIAPLIEETYNSVDIAKNSKDTIVSKIEAVTAVSQEVSAGAEQITASTEEMLATSEELKNLAELLNSAAQKLNDNMSKFKV